MAFDWADSSAMELGGADLLPIDRLARLRARRPFAMPSPEEELRREQLAAMGLPEFGGAETGLADPVMGMAKARTKKIFGVNVPQRRLSSALGALAGMKPIQAGGGFENFLSNFQGTLGAGLQAGQQYDQQQADAEQAEIDRAYKQQMIDSMKNKVPDDGRTAEQKNFADYLAMDPEKRKAFGEYRNIADNAAAKTEFERYQSYTPEQRKLYDEWKGSGKDGGDDETYFKLSPAAQVAAALRYKQSGALPSLGAREMGVKSKFDIMNRASELFPDMDIESNKANLRANSQSLTKLQSQADAVEAFENTVNNNTKVMKDAMASIKDTGTRFGNKLLRATQSQMGDPSIARFQTALRAIQNEYARIITQPNLSGPLTDTARHEVEELAKGDFTKEQLMAAVEVLEKDAANRRDSFDRQIAEVQARLSWNEHLANPPKEEVYTRDPVTKKLVRVE